MVVPASLLVIVTTYYPPHAKLQTSLILCSVTLHSRNMRPLTVIFLEWPRTIVLKMSMIDGGLIYSQSQSSAQCFWFI